LQKTNQTYHVLLIFLLCTVFATNNFSQEKYYTSYTISIDDGLSQNSINCIIKDKNGFLWLGTEEGLNRYDGRGVTVFSSEGAGEAGLLNNTINCLLADEKNDLIYVGTNGGGLSIFDQRTERFNHFVYDGCEGCISSGFIYDLCFDNDSNVVVASSYGISIFNASEQKFDNFEGSEDYNGEFPYVAATSVFVDEAGVIWAGTYGEGLVKLNAKNRTYEQYFIYSGNVQDRNSNVIQKVNKGLDENAIWLATDGGLYEFDATHEKFGLLYLKDTKVSGFEKDGEGGVWLSCGLEGLIHVLQDGSKETFKNDPFDHYSLKENYIRCIMLDDRKHLWVGTKSSGCIHLNIHNKQFVHYYQTKDGRGINGTTVYALNKDEDNRVWIGTMKGLSTWNVKNNSIHHYHPFSYKKEFSVWAIHHQGNNLWIGTSDGLVKHNKVSKQNTIFSYVDKDNESLPDNEVYALENHNDDLWIGTAYGIARLNLKTQKVKRYKFVNENGILSNEMVWDIHSDNNNRLWITTPYGINLYNSEKDSLEYLFDDGFDSSLLTSSSVNSVCEDSRGRIWLATNKGVCLLNDKLNTVIKSYGIKDGMANSYVYRIFEHDNTLWVSTNNGIVRIDLDTDLIFNYDARDGLQSNEFNIAADQLEDGRLVYGGIKGVSVFHPDSIKQSKYIPPIYFTSLEMYGKPVSAKDTVDVKKVIVQNSMIHEKQLHFKPNERFFTVSFAALDYQDPSQIEYFYRMLPNSKEWIPLKSKRDITFIDLSSGKYLLQVRSTNAEGYLCNNIKSLNITIEPPLWKKAWFISVLVFVITLLVYILGRLYYLKVQRDKDILEKRVRLRTKEIQLQRNIAHRQRDEIARQKEELETFTKNLEELVNLRTEELMHAKEAAEESDRLKSAFLSNMSHEIRTPMNAIMGFSELLLDDSFDNDEKTNFAHLIRTNGDNLLHLLNDIIDISMIESGQLKVSKSNIDACQIVTEVFETFKTSKLLSEKENISYELSCPEKQIIVVSDIHRLRQILNNLISNAIKFTASGFVKVSLRCNNDFAIFSVEDSGIGISKEHQSRIFDRFLKLESNNKDLYAGNGLGLTITKNLVELLNGQIGLESELGAGTRFYFSVPLVKDKMS